MKILLANKFYYPRGGGDIYMIELEKLLKENGHEIAIFSMNHPLNLETEYSKYFPKEIDVENKKSLSLIRFLIRPFGSFEVRRNFTRLLKKFKPDVIHLNNIHTQLSPIIAQIAHKRGIPVVWTLHDHKLLCPRYDCTRDGKPCELCFYSKINSVRYKCMKNSLMASLVAYFEALVWNQKHLSRITDTFICPSSFLMKNMIKGGFNPDQLVTLSNFLLDQKLTPINVEKQDYYCYIGRLSPEKGIETLLKAAVDMPHFKLKVVGTGPLENELKAKYSRDNIEFMGFRNWDVVKHVLASSQCMVIPSECYENNPLSVIEALCLGTPVVGARIGGIPELIQKGINGFIFEAGNVEDLKKQIANAFRIAHTCNTIAISNEARAKYNSKNYYTQLVQLYSTLLKAQPQSV